MLIKISGKAFFAGLDPLATDAPKEHGWPKPTYRKAGKGAQYIYDVTPEQAKDIRVHLYRLAGGFKYSDSSEAKAEGKAMSKSADRITKALAKGV